jgi:hypothetical protein
LVSLGEDANLKGHEEIQIPGGKSQRPRIPLDFILLKDLFD